MAEPGKVLTFCGAPVRDMSREELIEALHVAADTIERLEAAARMAREMNRDRPAFSLMRTGP